MERRFTTILAGDVAGFCIQMGRDDEQTYARLLKCRQIVETNAAGMNGSLFGVAGDSWMAEFASPVRAVLCAAAIQRAVETFNADLPPASRIRYRLGLHMGDVIAGGRDLFGEDVNIAARLQEICTPGQLVLSDAVFRHVIGKVDLRFRGLGPRRLKNIAKDISAFAAELQAAGGAAEPAPMPALEIWAPLQGPGGRPAIAVLPFQTSGMAEDEAVHFGEGFAEDVAGQLCNLRWLPVISHCSSFIFKGQAFDIQTVGQALQARYVATGSFRRAGPELLRLRTGLADTATGLNLWSHRYELNTRKLLEERDQIIASLVSLLEAEVERAERARLQPCRIEDLSAWELVRRGIGHLQKFRREDAVQARACFEQALLRDPGSAEARIQLGWWKFLDVWTQRGDTGQLYYTEAMGRQALLIDPDDSRGHFLIGIALMMTARPEEARHHYAEALRLNPSFALAHACLGTSFILSGQPGEALEPLLHSVRVNSNDPLAFHFSGELAMAFYMLGKWDQAIERAARSLQMRPNYWYAKSILIGSLARSGQLGKARALAKDAPADISIQQINWLPFIDKTWNGYLLDGLKLAGCGISGPE